MPEVHTIPTFLTTAVSAEQIDELITALQEESIDLFVPITAQISITGLAIASPKAVLKQPRFAANIARNSFHLKPSSVHPWIRRLMKKVEATGCTLAISSIPLSVIEESEEFFSLRPLANELKKKQGAEYLIVIKAIRQNVQSPYSQFN